MSDELFVGLMSGTSLDGVDAVVVRFDDGGPHCLATQFRPFADDMRAEALALQRPGNDQLRRALLLANALGDIYAETTNELLAKAGVPSAAIRAIGCHGQTLLHSPADGYSLQLNNPARLVEKTGIAVVADFRNRDIAAGGQGAPLVPAFHDAAFRHPDVHRVVVNIGGIANVTNLAPGAMTTGFDCGPGNMLLDAWYQKHAAAAYDAEGKWAARGNVLPELMTRLRAHPFFEQVPPKSCGREEFDLATLQTVLSGDEPAVDVQATLLALSAGVIANAVNRWCRGAEELYVCGGGSHNLALMNALAEALPALRIATTDALGLPVDWVEAIAFAWLARQNLHALPGNLPAATGARGPRVLGAVYPA